jgi:hypothetical protein
MNTFLTVISHQCCMYYLSTFFMFLLKRDRSWSSIQNCFSTSTVPDMSTPTVSADEPILIPCHVNGIHWVDPVRRVIRNRVHFFYADDLNHHDTEQNIKQLLTNHADRRFYPTDAIWVSCPSVTYSPHSNKCGPRTLFALMVLALHPTPSARMLLPFMTSNLAQILRTWVSFGLLQGNVIIPTFTSSTTAVEAPPNISIPAYLFSWTHSSTPTQPPRSSLTCKEKRQPKPKPTPSHASLSSTGPNLNQRPLSSCCGNTATASPSPQHFKTGKSFQRTLYDTFNITSPEH